MLCKSLISTLHSLPKIRYSHFYGEKKEEEEVLIFNILLVSIIQGNPGW